MKRIFGFIVLIVVLLGVPPHTMTCSADHNRYYKSMSAGLRPIPYATWNAGYIITSGNSLDATNLVYTVNSGSGTRSCIATIGKSSGKYMWEYYLNTYTSLQQIMVGVATSSHTNGTCLGLDAVSYGVGAAFSTPYKLYNSGYTAYGVSFSAGDVITVAADFTGGTLNVYKNGTIVGSSPAFSGLSGTWYPAISNVTADGFVVTANFGQNAWDSRTASLRATLAGAGYTMGVL